VAQWRVATAHNVTAASEISVWKHARSPLSASRYAGAGYAQASGPREVRMRLDVATENEPEPVLDRVLREEADFANEDYKPYADNLDIDLGMFRRYRLPQNLADWRQMSALLMGDIAGKQLLDFGCGLGEEAIYLAKLGAKVTAIDISEVGIASLRKRAEYNNVDVRALQMRGDPTSFAAGSFDVVHGLGILHHLGIEAGLAEVHRVLKPGGIGVFLEPMGDSEIVEAIKTWLMTHARFLGDFDHVTDHEHNLTWQEVHCATSRFSESLVYPYHLLYRLKRFFPTSLLPAIRLIDASMLTLVAGLRHFAGGVAIRVRK
jgi:2-polyprenyl-3-methyl-5-hydroxy-6-metoxy-1,4-benzoquinol methylase